MKKFLSIILSFAIVFTTCEYSLTVNANEQTQTDKYSSIYSADEINLAMGNFDDKNGMTVRNDLSSVTGTWNCVINPKPIYLPYGSAFVFDIDKTIYKNTSLRLYRCDDNGKNNTELTASDFAPSNTEISVDNDYNVYNFVCNEVDGMYINIRILPWQDTLYADDVACLTDCISVYDLTAINAPIFNNSTITQCWDNTCSYEGWPLGSVIYNNSNNLYYLFYSPQSGHTTYDSLFSYRTSKDTVTWSEPVTCVSENTNNEAICGANYLYNGDILVTVLSDEGGENTTSYFYRSKDNGQTFVKENFVLDSVDVTALGYRTQRTCKLDDGRLIGCYYTEDAPTSMGVCISNDNGKSFISSDYNSVSSSQGEFQFVLLDNGNILCVERTSDGIYIAISQDNGKSFAYEKQIPNNKTLFYNYKTPAEISYNSQTDALEIYFIDRYATGALCCIYTTGDAICNWAKGDNEFVGFSTRVASLGLNGNSDQGYPEIVKLENGNVKCFYYHKAIDSINKTSIYSIDGKQTHCQTTEVKENVVSATCQQKGEYDLVVRCVDCSQELSRKHIVLEKTGHSYTKSTIPATTSSNGFVMKSCKYCGYTYIYSYIYSISSVSLSTTSYTYNGNVRKPVVTVKDSKGNTLKNGTDYTLTYASGRKNVGKYSVKVTFKGNYSGSKTLYFTIKPKSTSLSSVTSKKKGFTVKWKKQSTQVSGYQIQYSTSSKFTNAKTKTISGASNTSRTVSKLSYKKYYVRVRTYKTVNGTNYYSAWSGYKSVKTK